MRRFSIAAILVVVGFVALAFGAIKASTPLWSGVIHALTLLALSLALLGVFLRGRREPALMGFAVVGWTFYLSSLSAVESKDPISASLSTVIAQELLPIVHPVTPGEDALLTVYPSMSGEEFDAVQAHNLHASSLPRRNASFIKIVQDVLCMMLALIGALAGSMIEGRDAPGSSVS